MRVGYLGEDGVMHMIFGETPARPSRCQEKLIRCRVYNTKSATPSHLKWSETLITFDCTNHTDRMP
jgi:hypothetical protein